MYSVVLMAAMTQAVEVPDFHRRGGHGCHGGGYGGCYGGGGWGGCWGGYGGGWGGCYGGGYGGCYGGGYGGGCYGGRWAYGGGGWGTGYAYSPYGSYGTGYASYPSSYQMMPYTGGMEYRSGYYAPSTYENGYGTNSQGMMGRPEQLRDPNQATIVVHLPADARLTVDGEPTRSTSDERVFTSPPLQPGQTYYYVFKAEMDRNGEKVTATQNVTVRAGQTSQVTMEFPRTGSNQERDRDLNRNRAPEANRNRDQDRDRR